jgi:hypothetical protein
MTTEGMNLDQAVEKMFGSDEPVQEVSDQDIMEEDTSDAPDVSEDTEDDSEVDYSDDDSEEYATDEESADDYEDEPDYAEPEKITVKVDGEEISVTLEDLKRSYSGQGKIQKGMQEAAEARKQAQQMQEQMNAVAQRLSAMYQQVQETGFVPRPTEPTRELFDSDPIGYMEAKMQYDADIKAYNEQQGQMMQLRQYQQQQMAQANQARLAQETELLAEKIPEFSDPEKAGKLREDLVKTASEFYGYSPEDLSGVTDHRALLVLKDAMMWRKSQAKKSQIEQKANKARPVIKPQAKRTADPKRKQVQQSKSNLKKSGRIEDALSLMFK